MPEQAPPQPEAAAVDLPPEASAPQAEGVVTQIPLESHIVGSDLVTRRLAPCSMHECGGRCCRFGAIVNMAQAERITTLVPRLLPLIRPAARRVISRLGWSFKGTVRERYADTDEPYTASRVVAERCVFVMDAQSGGCALHALALEDAQAVQFYKPLECVLFPLNGVVDGRVHVHAWPGYPCTTDAPSHPPAYQTLRAELGIMLGGQNYESLVEQINALRADGIEFIPPKRPDPPPVPRGRKPRTPPEEPLAPNSSGPTGSIDV